MTSKFTESLVLFPNSMENFKGLFSDYSALRRISFGSRTDLRRIFLGSYSKFPEEDPSKYRLISDESIGYIGVL